MEAVVEEAVLLLDGGVAEEGRVLVEDEEGEERDADHPHRHAREPHSQHEVVVLAALRPALRRELLEKQPLATELVAAEMRERGLLEEGEEDARHSGVDEEDEDERGGDEAGAEGAGREARAETPEEGEAEQTEERVEGVEEEEAVEAGEGREVLEEAVEREELLRRVGDRVEEAEEGLDLGGPVEAERGQQHEELEVVEDEAEVGGEEGAWPGHRAERQPGVRERDLQDEGKDDDDGEERERDCDEEVPGERRTGTALVLGVAGVVGLALGAEGALVVVGAAALCFVLLVLLLSVKGAETGSRVEAGEEVEGLRVFSPQSWNWSYFVSSKADRIPRAEQAVSRLVVGLEQVGVLGTELALSRFEEGLSGFAQSEVNRNGGREPPIPLSSFERGGLG